MDKFRKDGHQCYCGAYDDTPHRLGSGSCTGTAEDAQAILPTPPRPIPLKITLEFTVEDITDIQQEIKDLALFFNHQAIRYALKTNPVIILRDQDDQPFGKIERNENDS